MKSLEHIIREIRQGKTEAAQNKSVEHAARDIMERRNKKEERESSFGTKDSKPVDEASVGVTGTDKFQGTEFKNIKGAVTPHIEPPKGDESHSQAPERVSKQRATAKETQGINRVEEQAVLKKATPNAMDFDPSNVAPENALSTPLQTTGVGATTGGGKTGKVSTTVKIGNKVTRFTPFKQAPQAGEPARKAPEPSPIVPKPNIPDSVPTKVPAKEVPKPANKPGKAPTSPVVPKPNIPDKTPPTREKPSTTPANVPAPATPAPKEKPATPKAPETPKVEPAPAAPAPGKKQLPDIEVKPAKAPAPEKAPEKAPAVEPTPAAKPSAEPAAVPAPAAAPAKKVLPAINIGTKAKPATAPSTSAAPVTAPAAVPSSPSKPGKAPGGKGGWPFGLPGMFGGATENPAGGVAPRHLSPWKTHHARQFSVKEEARKEIENMPRDGERKSIEYVGRKDADPKSTKEKTSRLATVKKVIDEAKKEIAKKSEEGKTRVFDYGDEVLIINPNPKRNDLGVEDNNKVPKDYDNK